VASAELRRLLDHSRELLTKGIVDSALQRLMLGLWTLRETARDDQWNHLICEGRMHPIHDILREDPMTEWAFKHPRGYPGDAVLLDHAYELGQVVANRLRETTTLGRQIYDWLITYSGVTGLKERRRFIASLLDDTAALNRSATVLSLACGHARELELSNAAKHKQLHFVGLDQDLESLQALMGDYGWENVSTAVCNVRDLLKDPGRFSGFDLVYSSGLFDYLPDSLAQRVLEVMIQMARPGGRIVIANGLQGVSDTGYIEMFMDWQLIYRTEANMPTLLSRLHASMIASSTVFSQQSGHFVFLDVRRAS
jgi:SAM-dependent methyltransferase